MGRLASPDTPEAIIKTRLADDRMMFGLHRIFMAFPLLLESSGEIVYHKEGMCLMDKELGKTLFFGNPFHRFSVL